jgi:hypothetical protein
MPERPTVRLRFPEQIRLRARILALRRTLARLLGADLDIAEKAARGEPVDREEAAALRAQIQTWDEGGEDV